MPGVSKITARQSLWESAILSIGFEVAGLLRAGYRDTKQLGDGRTDLAPGTE